ncbi:Toxin YhaV [Photorhabdus australis subsp. thailandensis]|uniref:Toxin YhaV n=1 Tax=Photorhabdus australis subsp. thailandensis TaxID=2805096 RepID=A0A1C0U0V0_9GAMM|nr:Toxin YhaV [Photorhabdus australis subsp. thailandensis]
MTGGSTHETYTFWRRAKIGRRFRLFFRYDSKAKVIVYAWVNDEETLRSEGSKSDPYAAFEKMLGRGNPPDDWATLITASRSGHNRSNSEIEGNKDVMQSVT